MRVFRLGAHNIEMPLCYVETGFKSSSCCVCKHNHTLEIIRSVLTDTQVDLKLQWKSARVGWAEENLFPSTEKLLTGLAPGKIPKEDSHWFLLGEGGIVTVIPSYSLFNLQWGKAFFSNPLEVDWREFDIHSSTDMEYLISSIEMLRDQQDLWMNDFYTKEHSVMRAFNRFVSLLKRLLMFASSNSEYTG